LLIARLIIALLVVIVTAAAGCGWFSSHESFP